LLPLTGLECRGQKRRGPIPQSPYPQSIGKLAFTVQKNTGEKLKNMYNGWKSVERERELAV